MNNNEHVEELETLHFSVMTTADPVSAEIDRKGKSRQWKMPVTLTNL